ncbi:MAG TPA: SLC13 family permease [Gammaproteobacteria bacterium]|nr:SLC13 family permease [Gammaproteobacteria bacterium]
MLKALGRSFLGSTPGAYKLALLSALVLNPILYVLAGPFWAGWALVVEFLGVLALSLACYPLAPGGLLAIEAVLMGLASPTGVYHEVSSNFPVLLLLMFMVAGIYFLRDLIERGFLALVLGIRNRVLLALSFLLAGAVLSAFLDALTVMAVVITVAFNLHETLKTRLAELNIEEREQFESWLSGLVMQAAIGTALGGVTTLVGEPQNLLIAKSGSWHFVDFFLHMAPVTMPALAVGVACCLLVERMGWFGYGVVLPDHARVELEIQRQSSPRLDAGGRVKLLAQAAVAVLLILGLAFHVAEIGLIGLGVIVLAGAFTGARSEHDYAPAFLEALPFAALLVVFFAIVAVIESQHLFTPIAAAVLSIKGRLLAPVFYLVNGGLSAISDNVFVASVFLHQAENAVASGHISRAVFQQLIVAINAGTNIPSIATPNGQAAFLFLLASPLAPLLRLSYGRMMWMALPYTVLLVAAGLVGVWFFI